MLALENLDDAGFGAAIGAAADDAREDAIPVHSVGQIVAADEEIAVHAGDGSVGNDETVAVAMGDQAAGDEVGIVAALGRGGGVVNGSGRR